MQTNGSGAIIVNDHGQVLLIKRACHPYYGFWAFPGGKCEDNETLQECVKREVKEETGLDVEAIRLFCELTIKDFNGLDEKDSYFICRPLSLDMTYNPLEVSDHKFVDPQSEVGNIVHWHEAVLKHYATVTAHAQ